MSGSVASALQTALAATGFIPGAIGRTELITRALTTIGTDVVILRRPRFIGTIMVDVAIEEQQTDRIQLTQHPVAIAQQGQPGVISDHAYRMPRAVTMRCGWSNNPLGVKVPWGLSRVELVYAQLLQIQGMLQPIVITTGKRSYQDMMLTEL